MTSIHTSRKILYLLAQGEYFHVFPLAIKKQYNNLKQKLLAMEQSPPKQLNNK